jgi:Family of unknown function (DUF6882)
LKAIKLIYQQNLLSGPGMSEQNYNLSLYEELVTKHYFNGLARSLLFDIQTEEQNWQSNLDDGIICFENDGAMDIEVLGTIDAKDEFLWAWAHPQLKHMDSIIQASIQLKNQAEMLGGLDLFIEPRLSMKWVHAVEFASVSGELLGHYPFLIRPHGDADIVFLIKTQISIAQFPGIYIPRLLLDGQKYCYSDRKNAIKEFFNTQGFTFTDNTTTLEIQSSDKSLSIGWNMLLEEVSSINGTLWQ